MKKISILSPVRNEERYLDQMIASIVDQSYPRWELLLVNDGSTDATARIVAEWVGRDDRVREIGVGQRVGKVAAFNLARSHATGSLICHVGGDDLLPPHSLATRVRALEEAPCKAVLFGKLQVIDSSGRYVGGPIPRGPYGSQSGPGATYTEALCNRIFPIPEELPAEDVWLGNAAVGVAEAVLHTTEPIVLYRIHGNNSHPRSRPFDEMNDSIHRRQHALKLLSEAFGGEVSAEWRRTINSRWSAEQRRYARETLSIMVDASLPIADRLGVASMSTPRLWRLRQRLGTRVSGWRRR